MSKTPYQIHQEIEQAMMEEEWQEIEDKLNLTPEEIWALYPENFYKWRKKHDFPRILHHFSTKLNGFEEWKKTFDIDDSFLMEFGISHCINSSSNKSQQKYQVEKKWRDSTVYFIAEQNMDGYKRHMGPDLEYYKVVKTFTTYIDWCNQKSMRIMDDWADNGILSRMAKSSLPGQPSSKVSILGGLTLLKVGGIRVLPDNLGILKSRYLEFVNADFLELGEELGSTSYSLEFKNAYVDHLTCINTGQNFVSFDTCSLTNLYIKGSVLTQWTFRNCHVSGKMEDSDLRDHSIYGGIYNLDFAGCVLNRVHALHDNVYNMSYEYTYRTLKKIYADQGDDSTAIRYLLLEKLIYRNSLKLEFKKRLPYEIWPLQKAKVLDLWYRFKNIHLRYAAEWINNFYWGYGRKPGRVLRCSLGFIILFALIYWAAAALMHLPDGENHFGLGNSLYFSTVTFTTLGYGDFYPIGALRFVAAAEACIGGVSLGFLVGAFASFKY